MPSRADIDPADLKRILPNILLAKIDRESRRVRYTLVGTRCVAHAGMDYTGHYLDEIDFTCDFDTDWDDIAGDLFECLHRLAPEFAAETYVGTR